MMYIIGWTAAIIIEILIACMTQEFIWLGIMIVTVGFMLLACLLHGHAKIRSALIALITYCMIWGFVMISLSLIIKITDRFDDYDVCAFMVGLGIIFAAGGLYMGIIKKLQCNVKISAVYTGAQAYTVKGHTTYTPAFSFKYKGNSYSNTSGESFSKRKIESRFQVGSSYDIFINPENPNSLCVSRKLEGSWILVIMLGALFIWIPFLGKF